MKILVIGDSFAADWTVKYPTQAGWVNLLANKYDVTNLAQAGVSEYKILKQLQSVSINRFDLVIASHTSSSRVHTKQHPIHNDDLLHKNADLILSDILYHRNTVKGFFNRALKAAVGYFKYHYDSEYQTDIYCLIRNNIKQQINVPYLVVSNYITPEDCTLEENVLHLAKIQLEHKGLMNHMSDTGNRLVFEKVEEFIETL